METKDTIFESGIEVTIGEFTYEYDVECKDGEAIGTLCDSNAPIAPKTIKMTYPKLADVLADEDMANHVLQYRGLYDLTPSDIHYGDVMMTYGDVASVIIAQYGNL